MHQTFEDFMEKSCLALAREVPEFPTQMGLFEIAGEAVPQDYFASIDTGSVAARQQLLQTIDRNLDEFANEDLDDAEQQSADVLRFVLRYAHERGLVGMAGGDFLRHEYLLRPSVGLQSDLPLFLSDLHPMRHVGDAENYVSRMSSIAPLLREADQQQREREPNGLLPPAIVIQNTISEIERFIDSPVHDNILYRALDEKTAELADLGAGARSALLADANDEITSNIHPAYLELLATLRQQVAQAPEDPGVWQLPGGDAWYEFMLRAATTTELSAEEIHEIGIEETDRLEREILTACRDTGIEAKTISECYMALDSNKPSPRQDTPQNRQAIVDQIASLIADTEPQLEGLFHQLPAGKVIVKTIPLFAESNRNQSYQPPSLDGTRPGFFELNVGQLLEQSDFELPILVYHEIFPGHHLQICLAQEMERLPSLRRIMTFDAYIEGWAKYAETIPSTHGISNDPRFNIARMRRELISTINLALDTGIHEKRWSEEHAVQFFATHSGMSESFSRHMVHRSASVPAQLCSYKIGMMKMFELKTKMERELGSKFDIRDFHRAVLGNGAVPLSQLDSIVNGEVRRLIRGTSGEC